MLLKLARRMLSIVKNERLKVKEVIVRLRLIA
jgi:hypothetical protein